MRFDALPGSGREAQEVVDLWRGIPSSAGADDVSALLGREASEQTVKRLAPGRRILHLATHGFFLGDECGTPLEGTRAVGGLVATNGAKPAPARPPRAHALPENPLLLSGLALAGANRRTAAGPQEDDGILTAEEVAALNLEGVEWAVLSACDTGLGQLRAGEGVFGLRRAFQVAGARTVVMSLWQVEDRSARVWMRALYEGRLVQGLDTADAVREASLSVLRDRRARQQSTHPFYWAGFVAAGDWR
jgi:CHAT domain-containing protein